MTAPMPQRKVEVVAEENFIVAVVAGIRSGWRRSLCLCCESESERLRHWVEEESAWLGLSTIP